MRAIQHTAGADFWLNLAIGFLALLVTDVNMSESFNLDFFIFCICLLLQKHKFNYFHCMSTLSLDNKIPPSCNFNIFCELDKEYAYLQ